MKKEVIRRVSKEEVERIKELMKLGRSFDEATKIAKIEFTNK